MTLSYYADGAGQTWSYDSFTGNYALLTTIGWVTQGTPPGPLRVIEPPTLDVLPADTGPPEAKRVNQVFPGSDGGVIETTKRAIIVGLREAVTGTELNHLINGSKVNIDMEYPMTKEKYPGIWVQFSFTKFINAGLDFEMLLKEVENPGTDEEWVNWEPLREFQFEGRVTLTVVALTSLERDRISDAITTMLMFSRPPAQVITRADKDTKQFRQLIESLQNNPFISMTLNLDTIIPGTQAVTPGVPWDPDIMGYEDTYSFDLLGQTNILFKNDGTYSLRRIDWIPEMVAPSRYEWQ